MSSKIDIQKRCKWCNAVFTAHKSTTEYCSHRCVNLAYKDRVRKQRIESLQHELGKIIKTPPNLNKEYLTPSEVAVLLNIGRTSIYRYIRNGVIKVIRFERKTLVRRADIEDMTDFIVPETENKQLKEKAPITDFYTTAEVKEKYHVNESWIFVVAKKNNIPRTFNREYYCTPVGEPMILLGYSEQCFNIAEAINLGWIEGDADAYYKAGIRASMESYNLDEAVISDYINSPAVAYNNDLEQILNQKYISFFNNSGWEPFYNMRRTGVPAYQIGSNMSNPSGKVPVRWRYPRAEYQTNEANVKEAIKRQYDGSDDVDDVMWILK